MELKEKKLESFSFLRSISKWGPIITVLLFAGIAYGVQRTSLSLFGESFTDFPLFESQENFQRSFIVFLQISSAVIAYGLFKGIAGFFSATISSKYQRKWTIRIGLILVLCGSFALAFSRNLWALPLGNAFIGGGLGLLFTSTMSALTDIAGYEGAAFSVGSMEFSVYLGSSFGSFLAGVIANNLGFAETFIFALIIAGTALAFGFIFIKKVETTDLVAGTKDSVLLDATKVESRWSTKNIFRVPTLILANLGGHISRITDSILVLIFPLLLSTVYGFSNVQIGIATSVFTLAWSTTMPFTGKLSDRIGRKTPMILGFLLAGTSIILIVFTELFGVVVLLTLLAGLGTSLYYPSLPSITKDVVPIIKREKSIGIYRSSLDSGYFTGPLIVLGLAGLIVNIDALQFLGDSLVSNVFKFPFLFAGTLLIILGFSFSILAIETRPGWVQASHSIKHAEKVQKTIHLLAQSFKRYLDGDKEQAIKLMMAAKKEERLADDLVFKVTQVMYSSVRPAPDDYHFYKLTTTLDKAIGYILRSLRKILYIPRKKIDDYFSQYLIKECELLCDLIDKSVEVLEVVCIQPLASHPIFNDVHAIEHELDINNHKALERLLPETEKMSTVEILYIDQIIEELEISANTIEDAVDIMKIIGLKYQIRPLVS
ncbi:MAG: MFS transporter [Candidatus Heimdallarchaeaceae archaeon]